MASEDGKESFSLPDHQALDPAAAPFALCFALSLYFLLIQNPNTPLAFAIKLSNGVVQASRAFKYVKSPSPSPAALFLASKVLIKGIKFSQRLIPAGATAGPSPPRVTAGKLKGCVAAVNLLRYARHPPHADMPMGLGFLNSGHKFSKNLLRVVDVFMGFQLDEVFRRNVDALGLLYKAAVVVRVIGERVGANGWVWRRNSYGFRRVRDLRCGVRLRCERYFDIIGKEKRLNCFWVLDFGDCDVAGVKGFASELLSLSIPIEEVVSANILQRL